jgi:hypothetical protein
MLWLGTVGMPESGTADRPEKQKTPSEEGVLVERTTRFELATLTLAR